uniref:EGF-like domain-containing protein n=1 Tax=Caenorhabditis japonica TaxID=281687 RepID=A0A8R1DTH9_CAEJA
MVVDAKLNELRLGQLNVCPHDEIEIVTLKQPFVQAYTKYVKKRKTRCHESYHSCTVRQPKTIYFHTYKEVNRTRRHTVAECCPGWTQVPGEAGCQKANCSVNSCHNGGTCVQTGNRDNERVCECQTGFTGNNCQYDINECLDNNGDCEHECVNTIGAFYCRCWPGFQLSTDGKRCTDIDECSEDNGGCSHNCVNRPGGFKCECPPGLYLHSNGRACGKDDPCLQNNGYCQHYCINNNGRTQCQCYPGFHLSYDQRSCVDVGDCNVNNGGCEQVCQNHDEGHRCSCKPGFELSENKHSCYDINECLINNGGCSQLCKNLKGYHTCHCFAGYTLTDNKKSCIDSTNLNQQNDVPDSWIRFHTASGSTNEGEQDQEYRRFRARPTDFAMRRHVKVLKMVNAFVLLEKKVISVMIPVKAVVLEQVAVASVNARTVQLVILSPDLAIANLDGKGNTVRNRVQMGDLVLDAIQFVPAPSQIVPWHKIFIQQVAIMLQENAGVLLGGQVQAVRHRAH